MSVCQNILLTEIKIKCFPHMELMRSDIHQFLLAYNHQILDTIHFPDVSSLFFKEFYFF